MVELFHSPSYDFIGKRKCAYMASGLVILRHRLAGSGDGTSAKAVRPRDKR